MWSFFKNRKSDISELTSAVAMVVSRLDDAISQEEPSDKTSKRLAELDTRVEALELRAEQLKEECIRYLQKGSQRMKRAEELADQDDEENVPVALPEFDFPNQAELDDRAWAAQQLRERGESPV